MLPIFYYCKQYYSKQRCMYVISHMWEQSRRIDSWEQGLGRNCQISFHRGLASNISSATCPSASFPTTLKRSLYSALKTTWWPWEIPQLRELKETGRGSGRILSPSGHQGTFLHGGLGLFLRSLYSLKKENATVLLCMCLKEEQISFRVSN